MTGTDAMELELPSQAAFAVTARVFVVTAARHHGVDERTVEDLRLAASELFTNALEHGRPVIRFTLRPSDDGPVFRAEGVGSLSHDEADDGVWAVTRRMDVLETLFDGLRVLDDDPGTVEIPLAKTA